MIYVNDMSVSEMSKSDMRQSKSRPSCKSRCQGRTNDNRQEGDNRGKSNLEQQPTLLHPEARIAAGAMADPPIGCNQSTQGI